MVHRSLFKEECGRHLFLEPFQKMTLFRFVPLGCGLLATRKKQVSMVIDASASAGSAPAPGSGAFG